MTRYAAIVNANAGTACTMGAPKLRALFQEKLGEQLISLRIVRPRHIEKAFHEALRLSPDAVLVLGGDGTARSAAQICAKAQMPVAFLPGGTMNILPKRLFGEASLDDILSGLAEGRAVVTKTAAGFVGDAPFFVAAAFGFIPLLTRAREMQRDATTLRGRIAAIERILRHGTRLFKPSVVFETQKTGRRLSPALLVALGDADELVPGREAQTERPRLEAVSLNATSWTSLFAITLSALSRKDWRSRSDVDTVLVTEVNIPKRGRIRVTLDGEPTLMQGPLHIRYSAQGITALSFEPVSKGTQSLASADTSV